METSVCVRGYRICFVSVMACVLAACNYGENSSGSASASAANSTTVAGDHAPQISGVAATTAKVGQAYSFQPRATDANNDALMFAVSGAPSWVTFNAATGLITGTPTSADVGIDTGIVVQVSDGKSTASLPPFNITVVAVASSGGGSGASGGGTGTSSSGTVDLAWVPPTENTDGTPLINLNGYKIYYGHASKTYTATITIANPGLTQYVIDNLPAGTYYFSVVATTSSGVQSGYSPEATTTIS
jgi:hypothetical protein